VLYLLLYAVLLVAYVTVVFHLAKKATVKDLVADDPPPAPNSRLRAISGARHA
jgi:uncharacterized protein (UPF0333 family)